MLLFCVKTIIKESPCFELAHLKKMKKKESKIFWQSGDFLVQYFAMLFCTTRHVVDHEALEHEWYCVIKAYKFTCFEAFFGIVVYCVSSLSLHIGSTMILKCSATKSYKFLVSFVGKQ